MRVLVGTKRTKTNTKINKTNRQNEMFLTIFCKLICFSKRACSAKSGPTECLQKEYKYVLNRGINIFAFCEISNKFWACFFRIKQKIHVFQSVVVHQSYTSKLLIVPTNVKTTRSPRVFWQMQLKRPVLSFCLEK